MYLKIFGWKIKVTNSTQIDNVGEYSYKERSIKINPKYNKTKKEKDITLVHELVHCVVHRLGLHNASLSHDLEEILADNISVAINENANITWKKHK